MSPWTGCMCYFWSKVAVSLIFIYLQECPVLSHLVDLKITGCFCEECAYIYAGFLVSAVVRSFLDEQEVCWYKAAQKLDLSSTDIQFTFHHQVTCTDDSCSYKCLLNLTKKKKRSELKATNPNKHCRTKDSTNFIKSYLGFHSSINSQKHILISSHGPKPSRSSSFEHRYFIWLDKHLYLQRIP